MNQAQPSRVPAITIMFVVPALVAGIGVLSGGLGGYGFHVYSVTRGPAQVCAGGTAVLSAAP